MQNGRWNRVGRLLRFGVLSVCVVRTVAESPRRGGLPRSFTPPHTSGQRTGSHRRHLPPRDVWRSGCVAARGGVGSGRQGRTQLPGMPFHLLRSGTGSHRRHLPPRDVWRSGCVAARGGVGSGRQGRTQLPGTPSHFLRLPPSPVSGRGFRSRRSGGRRRLRGTAARRVRWPKCSGDWDNGGACRPARVWQRA